MKFSQEKESSIYNKNMTTLSKYRKMKNNNNILKYKSYPSKPLITHCSYCFRELEQYKNKITSIILIVRLILSIKNEIKIIKYYSKLNQLCKIFFWTIILDKLS